MSGLTATFTVTDGTTVDEAELGMGLEREKMRLVSLTREERKRPRAAYVIAAKSLG